MTEQTELTDSQAKWGCLIFVILFVVVSAIGGIINLLDGTEGDNNGGGTTVSHYDECADSYRSDFDAQGMSRREWIAICSVALNNK